MGLLKKLTHPTMFTLGHASVTNLPANLSTTLQREDGAYLPILAAQALLQKWTGCRTQSLTKIHWSV
jgi:hypothetical protein